jgi:hypothetical protein
VTTIGRMQQFHQIDAIVVVNIKHGLERTSKKYPKIFAFNFFELLHSNFSKNMG